jgi:NADPH:quinone reductase
MKAVILDAPGPPDALQIQDLPILTPGPEQVLIKVAASGLNRSELHMWLGLAQGLTFPRVLGIEAAGTVAAWPAARFRFVSRIRPGLASSPTVKEP